MKAVGFTGSSRKAPSIEQARALGRTLAKLYSDGYKQLHHGEARCADTLANNVARDIGYRTVGHPATISDHRTSVDERYTPAPPLHRNRMIVALASHLVAMPAGLEIRRSGTWATIRYARKAGIPITIIWRDGTITKEGDHEQD